MFRELKFAIYKKYLIEIETEIETGGPVVKAGRGRRGARRPCHLSRDMREEARGPTIKVETGVETGGPANTVQIGEESEALSSK